ncbi:disulfide isomerase, putative [Talaromyces stipitatus ATCC 10500]|uniref:Disulfide isomerase, putative n=1 Tax=Talaromyces stipitatus (strain ATCC 10500 / CBS 375.48 / QM 6759 / NRRL 1006) TaxID=441959 RepID=B8M8S2_TALSN|nr:disulfide isomerase, putative [Talaromyces stipitatus ATCC 10500]EED20585.1 disulfide isomerase, putative [Talaromyces stipitatus ATCC 10500]
MKSSLLSWTLFSLAIVPSLATNVFKREEGTVAEDGPANTIFNGVEVPPQLELTQDNFKSAISDGYWFVKHFSPSCPHCQQIAPTWQTLYEFYYTSNPLSSSSAKSPDSGASLNSFTGYYDFHFAEMNCLAFRDLCVQLDIKFFPTFSLYHNGELVEQYSGKKDMQGLSDFIEEKLEQIRPGSRPASGLKLPEPGAKSVDVAAEPDVPKAKDKDPAAGVKAAEDHNEKISQLTETTDKKEPKPASKTTEKKPERPVNNYNPQGSSVPLTAESFQKFVTRTRDPWFVKFYAPWCHHCQALAPAWQTMAKEMQGKLNVGEVNCDVEKRLCKDAGVKGFPTMLYFKGGEKVEYEGLRGVGDLISYAQKAVDTSAGVKYVDAATFKEMEETGEVIFLYFFDKATTSEDFAALEQLALPLVGHARLVKTDSEILADRFKISTWPRLLVVRDGRPTYFNALAPYDMRDNPRVLEWMRNHWLPIVPELTVSNAKEIMQNKYVVLGILSHKRSDEFRLGQAELKNAALEWMDKQTQLFRLERQELRDAKQLRIEEAEDRDDQRALRAAKSMHINIREEDKKQVAFAWVDGDFWDRWLRTTYGIDVKDGERVIINDEDNRRYWDSTSSGAHIMPSRTSILETIPLVISDPPKLRSKSTIGFFEATFFHTKSFITTHPIWSAIILVISSIAIFITNRRRLLRRGLPTHGNNTSGGILGYGAGTGGGGFFSLDSKEGLLNGGSTGKVD